MPASTDRPQPEPAGPLRVQPRQRGWRASPRRPGAGLPWWAAAARRRSPGGWRPPGWRSALACASASSGASREGPPRSSGASRCQRPGWRCLEGGGQGSPEGERERGLRSPPPPVRPTTPLSPAGAEGRPGSQTPLPRPCCRPSSGEGAEPGLASRARGGRLSCRPAPSCTACVGPEEPPPGREMHLSPEGPQPKGRPAVHSGETEAGQG